MRLKEYEGKRLFEKYGIPVPKSKLITSAKEAPDMPDMIAKAQVLSGKRFKMGLIRPATRENIIEIFKSCDEVLLEEKLSIEKEYYISLAVDREEKGIVIIFSEEGGVDIEDSSKITKIPYSKLETFPKKEFLPIIKSMFGLMRGSNALLVEINPLVLSEGRFIAADAKVILDDNTAHPEFREPLTELEKDAKSHGLNYVELDGEIAIIGNGAGLVMATLDMISHFGGRVANFLDLGGGADISRMEEALRIVVKKKPKSILINIFGGITRCDEIAKGLVNYKQGHKLEIPIVVRMIGTNEGIAKDILLENGINFCDSMEEGARRSVEDANLNR